MCDNNINCKRVYLTATFLEAQLGTAPPGLTEQTLQAMQPQGLYSVKL